MNKPREIYRLHVPLPLKAAAFDAGAPLRLSVPQYLLFVIRRGLYNDGKLPLDDPQYADVEASEGDPGATGGES